MLRRTIVVLFAGLLLFVPLHLSPGQEIKEGPDNPFRELLARMTPEARLAYERLRKAEFASIELTRIPRWLGEPAERLRDPFSGDPRYFLLLISNKSDTSVGFAVVDIYQEHRPKLTREGQLVPFCGRTARLLVEKDTQIVGRKVRGRRLEPGEVQEEQVDLADWYEPLQPGHYQLTVRRRFIWGGDWIESTAMKFAVVAPGPHTANLIADSKSAGGRHGRPWSSCPP